MVLAVTAASGFGHKNTHESGWDVTKIVDSGRIFGCPSSSNPVSLAWGNDGTYLYILAEGDSTVRRHTTGVPYNFDNVANAIDHTFAFPQPVGGDPGSIRFSPDGTKMLFCQWLTERAIDYNLSTAWNVSTASLGSEFSCTSQLGTPEGCHWSPDGTKMYLSQGGSGGYIFQYTLSTPFTVSSASYDNKSLNTIPGSGDSTNGIYFKPDGTQLWHTGKNNDSINQWKLATAWDITTATYTGSYDVDANVNLGQSLCTGIFVKEDDGSKVYIVGQTPDRAYEFTM